MIQDFLVVLIKIARRLHRFILKQPDIFITRCTLYLNGVKFRNISSKGVPKVYVSRGGEFRIDKNFKMNNRESSNPIGRFRRCSFFVGSKGSRIIGENTGVSSCAIVCHDKIEIRKNVKLGGNVVIYDTDFHSLNYFDRMNPNTDIENTKTAAVLISDNVFIGAHSTILKGVRIGENSIIGACSVVTKDVPSNEIWAGNPAKFIRKLN